MGSFNMACAVTGASITPGEKVVAFQMIAEEPNGRGSSNLFNSQWFPSSFPLFGTYDDYGTVTGDDGVTSWENHEVQMMIIHRYAYDVLIEVVDQDTAEEDAQYVEYNKQGFDYINYRLKRQEKARIQLAKLKDITPDLKDWCEYSAQSEMGLGGEGSRTREEFWVAHIFAAADPVVEFDRVLNEVFKVIKAAHYVFFPLAPSLYANQEGNSKYMVKLFKAGLEFHGEVLAEREAEGAD